MVAGESYLQIIQEDVVPGRHYMPMILKTHTSYKMKQPAHFAVFILF